MTVTVYQSTDASAPVLDGSAGSLCTVLDAVLVNGYGAKAAAGWAIAFTGTSKRVYRPATGLLRSYLRVQDDAPRVSPYNNAREARITGFEVCTTVDVGTGKFPVSTNGIILQKSNDGTAKPWIVIADDRTVYMFVQSGDYGIGWASFAFGEYFSLKGTADSFNGVLIGNITETLIASPFQSSTNENLPKLVGLTAVASGHFVPRSWEEQGPTTANVGVGKHGNAAHSAAVLAGILPFPHIIDSGIWLSQVWLHEPSTNPIIRGRMRGFWHQLHPAAALKHGDTWSGTGALAGKSFMAIGPTPSYDGMFVIETSNTWETN